MSYSSHLTQKLIKEFGLERAKIIIKEMNEQISKKTNIKTNKKTEAIIKWI